ncbi:MAG: SIS domain-containing protein [Patescibacteria group bacterium]
MGKIKMEEAIAGLPEQFNFKPNIQEREKVFRDHDAVVVAGMGGSHLCAGALKALNPSLPIFIHNSYGLPEFPDRLMEKIFFVFVSYSGGTEEILDSIDKALLKNLHSAVITTGGALGERAEKAGIPRIIMPDTGIQPRNAIGYSTVSLATMLEDENSLKALRELSSKIRPGNEKEKGVEIAEDLFGQIPLVYSSAENTTVAYNWKVKFNETTKIPSFYNIFPEANHNEMEGFGAVESTKDLSSSITPYFLIDEDDHPRIQRRMDVTCSIYEERGVKARRYELQGNSRAERIFRGIMVADWASLELSRKYYNTDADNVPMVEKFKNIIKE